MVRSVRVSTRLDPETKAALERVAAAENRSESQILEIALKAYLASQRPT